MPNASSIWITSRVPVGQLATAPAHEGAVVVAELATAGPSLLPVKHPAALGDEVCAYLAGIGVEPGRVLATCIVFDAGGEAGITAAQQAASSVEQRGLGQAIMAGILNDGFDEKVLPDPKSGEIFLLGEDLRAVEPVQRLLLPEQPWIGYDAADLFGLWRGRIGWIQPAPESAQGLQAALANAQARLPTRTLRGVGLAFSANDAADPRLAERDALASEFFASVDAATDRFVAINGFATSPAQNCELIALFS